MANTFCSSTKLEGKDGGIGGNGKSMMFVGQEVEIYRDSRDNGLTAVGRRQRDTISSRCSEPAQT